MNHLKFVPFAFPQSDDGKYTALVTEDSILKIRRDQLGLSQQNVADLAKIPLTQYQRLETGDNILAGASMRIGLAVCAALLLDPYEFIDVTVSQPDTQTMKPVPMFHTELPDDLLAPKKTGRKITWKDIKTVFVNYEEYSLLIPYDVLNILGEPKYIQMSWHLKQRRIVIRAAEVHEEGALDLFDRKYFLYFIIRLWSCQEIKIAANFCNLRLTPYLINYTIFVKISQAFSEISYK